MRTVRVKPISQKDFERFGQVVHSNDLAADRIDLTDAIDNRRAHARPRASFITVENTSLPLMITQMERHAYSSQAFVSISGAYLVAVAPENEEGLPDAARLEAFAVPGGVSINYRANVWHHPIVALDRIAKFAVLTFVDGGTEDEQFVDIGEPTLVEQGT